ncbi:hypothetical protein, partial [Pararhizobium sp. DWP1-1-3]|uniref:hypothetical protein n=1 Tax=Pararhizobium sp. DWP1-1-3 TaxID=2804652 RepID=UPI003CF483D5
MTSGEVDIDARLTGGERRCLEAGIGERYLNRVFSQGAGLWVADCRAVIDDTDGEGVLGDIAVAVAGGEGEGEGEGQDVFVGGTRCLDRMIKHALEVELVTAASSVRQGDGEHRLAAGRSRQHRAVGRQRE